MKLMNVKGTNDSLPQKEILKRKVINTLSDTFEKCYFRVGLTTNYGENIFSIPFVINNTNGSITVEFLSKGRQKACSLSVYEIPVRWC